MTELTEEEFEKLVKEGHEFFKLRRKFKSEPNPEVGKPGYLISVAWIQRYKKYVFYDRISRSQVPSLSDVLHPHPGQITNSDFLETDSNTYLHGTNTEKGWESEYIDRYVKKTCLENQDYEIISEETWEFLSKQYGFDLEVKRYYIKKESWSYQTTLEITFKLVPVVLVFTDQLLN